MSGAPIAPLDVMNIGLSHSGASPSDAAFAAAHYGRGRGYARQAADAADRMRAEAVRAVQPANKLVESPSEIRAKVMSDRGVNNLTLVKLGAQARIEAEISINAETARRARQAQIRTTGNFVDLRV